MYLRWAHNTDTTVSIAKLAQLRMETIDLLLEEFEGDLGNDALQDPVGLLVERFDLGVRFGQRRELGWKLHFENLAEELDPGGHFLRLQQVRRNFNLMQRKKGRLTDP